MIQIGEYFGYTCERRLNDEVDETDLTLGNICCFSLIELTDWEAMDSF